MEEYPIYTENGKLFCKCRRESGEEITLLCKNGEIPFPKFVARVVNMKKPSKKPKRTCGLSG